MAQRTNRRPVRRPEPTGGRMTDGSAAFDRAYALRMAAQPAPQPRPQLPEERPAPRPRPIRVRAKAALSPFAIVGLAAVSVLLLMMISAYVRLYETTTEVSALTSELSALQSEQSQLTSQYESKIDLNHIEEMAVSELGMTAPSSDQTVYVNLSGPDQAEVIQTDRSQTAKTIWQAFSESVSDLLSDLKAYFQ